MPMLDQRAVAPAKVPRKVAVPLPTGQTALPGMREAAPAQRMAPVVAHIFPTFAVGGAQLRFAAIANHFGSAFRHIVVSLDGELACSAQLRPDLNIRFPPVTATKNAMASNAWRFRKLLRDWRPDVLVTCNWGAIEFALANILPVARHLHVVDGFGPEERTTQLARRVLIRRIVLRRTPVVLPSRSLVRIASEIWQLPPKNIRYVPNGIDLARFAMDGSRRGSANPVIGTVAALREEKNIARLLRAFATLSSGRLVIVGDGPERLALEALTAALGISQRVCFAGYHQDTVAFYAQFDIFALTSDTEQMPLSMIEAMASGLPIVATDVGDVRLMVAEENRPYVTKLNDAALAGALAALVADSASRRRVGFANLTKVRQYFDQAAMFAAHAALWYGSERHQPDRGTPADKVAPPNNDPEHADFYNQPENALEHAQPPNDPPLHVPEQAPSQGPEGPSSQGPADTRSRGKSASP